MRALIKSSRENVSPFVIEITFFLYSSAEPNPKIHDTDATTITSLRLINDAVVAKGGKPLDVQLYPKATDVFQQVMIGRAFAGSSQDTEISYRDLQTPGQLATVYTFPDKSSFGIYLRKDSADLAAVQAAVKALRENGKLGEIAGAWKLSPSQIDAAAQ